MFFSAASSMPCIKKSQKVSVYCLKQNENMLLSHPQVVMSPVAHFFWSPVSVPQSDHGGVGAGDNAGWDDGQCSI